MGSLLKRSIPSIDGLQEELDTKLVIEHIVDSLDSTETEFALSANQGRVLQDKKLDKLDIVDSLDSESITKVLSANQGRVLAEIAGTKINTASIVNDLTSDSTSEPLSAYQGKVLLGLINSSASGLQYRGAFDAEGATDLPTATAAGEFYIVSSDNADVHGLELKTRDMLISSGATDGTNASGWDKIDNTEAGDILRQEDVSSEITEGSTSVVNGQAVIDYLAATKGDALSAQPRVIVDRQIITGNVVTLAHEPIEGVIVDDKITIYNENGTYDEWEGATVTGNSMTIDDAGDTYNGRTCKVTYTYKFVPVTPKFKYATLEDRYGNAGYDIDLYTDNESDVIADATKIYAYYQDDENGDTIVEFQTNKADGSSSTPQIESDATIYIVNATTGEQIAALEGSNYIQRFDTLV